MFEDYLCSQGLPTASFASKNEVVNDFCLTPILGHFLFIIANNFKPVITNMGFQ